MALRFSLIASFVIGLLTLSAAIIARPELVSQPTALFGVCISLFVLFLVISFLLIIVPALIWKRGFQFSPGFRRCRASKIDYSQLNGFLYSYGLPPWLVAHSGSIQRAS